MEKDFSQTQKDVANYVLETFNPEDTILGEIKDRSQRMGLPPIQVGAMDGLHLEVLTRSINPKQIVEIGTLGGYSGVCLARGLSNDGKLYTFEYEPKHAEQAKISFEKAGVSKKVELFVGAALEQLTKIENKGPFDLVFIDADKQNYTNYIKWAEKNLRKGGVVLVDNTFAWGDIGKTTFANDRQKSMVEGIREANSYLAKSKNFRATILPTGEGLTMAVKL